VRRLLVLLFAFASLTACAPAHSVTIPYQLGTNPDGYRDTGNPCLDGVTNCRPPSTVGWNATTLAAAMAIVSAQTTGTATDIDLSTYCTGANCASATYALAVPVTNWSIGGTGTKHLLHAGIATGNSGTAGTLNLNVCYPNPSTCATSAPFNWSYTAPASTDTTPPITVTGVHVDSTGSGTVTISADASMDPDDAVQRKGLATYRFKRNAVTVDTLAADTGLVLDFTGTSIGSPMGALSVTQGSGATGGQWTIVGGGEGTDGAADVMYGTFAPVSGSRIYIIDRLDSLPNVKTYNKSHSLIRNSSSATAAQFDCVILRTGTTYFMQRVVRTGDGNVNSVSSATTLPGAPPYYRRTIVDSNLGSCAYSTDGGDWVNAFTGVAITLNNAKIAGIAASATTTGSDEANITIVEGEIGIQTVGRISKTLTVAAGSATYTTTVIDAESTPNESATVAGVLATPGSVTAPVKFHQGSGWIWEGTYLPNSLTTRLAGTQAVISQYCSNANIKGYEIQVLWGALEGSLGDYSDGFSGTDTLLNQATACGQRLMLNLNWSSFGSPVLSQPGCLSNLPSYLCNAAYGPCCTGQSSTDWNLGGGIAAGGGNTGTRTTTRMWSSTVADRLIALINAYCARYDGNANFEMIDLGGETAIAVATTDYNALVTQYGRLLDAAALACPHTMIRLPVNFTNTDSQMQQLIAKCATEPNCILGGPDPLYAAFANGKAPAGYAQAEQVWKGVTCSGCTVHDYSAAVAWVTETQADWIDHTNNGNFIGGGTLPTNCDESVAAIRTFSEGAVQNTRDLIWTNWVTCMNPAGAQTGIIDSINATPTITNTTCPANFTGGCTTN
jgi:hypothetical protein